MLDQLHQTYESLTADPDSRTALMGVLGSLLTFLTLYGSKWLLSGTRSLAGRMRTRYRSWRTPELTDFDEAVMDVLNDPTITVAGDGQRLICKRVVVWLVGHNGTGSFDVRIGDVSCLAEMSWAGRKAFEREACRLRDVIEDQARRLARMELMDKLGNPIHKMDRDKAKGA